MTVGAFSHRSGVLHFSGLDLLGLLLVAGYADRLCIFLGKNDFSVFRRLVAGCTRILVTERSVYEYLHQLGLRRLVRIVTSSAIGLVKRLIVMCLPEVLAFGIVAIEAELRNALGQ